MARYSLILKDTTFVDILNMATLKGETFGKYVNNLLNEAAKGTHASKPICFICGEAPHIVVHGKNGTDVYLCRTHERLKKELGSAWGEVKP